MQLITSPAVTRRFEKIFPPGKLKTLAKTWRAACAWLSLCVLALWATNASAQINWIDTDLGGPHTPGYTQTNLDGSYDIFGGGSDIWNNTSQCHYRYAWASGTTWDMTIQVANMIGVDATWTKCELMVNWADTTVGPQGSDAFIAAMNTLPTGDNEYGVDQFRVSSGNSSDWKQAGNSPRPVYPNVWMGIHRNGSVFTINYSPDGINWTNYISIDTSSSSLVGQDNGTSFGVPWPNVVAVGIAVTAHNDGGLLADATVAHISANFPTITAPTVVNPTVQVHNVSTTVGSEASFSFLTTNNANPNVVLPIYQWYKNGIAISNATGTSLTFLAAATDAGAQVYCKATLPAPYNTTVAFLNSATGTLTVASANIYTNGLKREFFAGVTSRTAVEAGNVGPATSINVRPNFDDPGGYGNNYIQRVSGYFIPPTSDNYVFFVASDDDSDLFLSTDSTANNKAMVAQETGWSGFDQWLVGGSGGGNNWAQQRSDTFVDPVSGLSPWTSGIPLTQGHLYYIEGVMHQGGGGDDFSVTYQTITQTLDPNWSTYFANGTNSQLRVASNNIAYLSYPDTTPTWTVQPTNATATQGSSVSFYSSATDGGEFAPNYQWYKGGAPVPGATGSTLYLASVQSSDSGASIYAVATAVVSGLSSTSSVVTLSIASPVLERGFTKVEYWYSFANKTTVESGAAAAPDHIITSPRFESASVGNSAGNNYTARLSTFFYPPTTDNYVFFVNDDDAGDLFVSTDSTPGNKQLVAQETGWSNPWQWLTAGSGTASQKRSDTWTTNSLTPWAAGIHMIANQPYYIELVKQDTGGGNNAEATFKRLSDPDPANGSFSAFTGNVIAINVPRSFTVSFTQQPTNTTVGLNGTATFTAAGATDSLVAVGTTGDPRPLWNNTLAFQWYRNSTLIPGATGKSYSTGPVNPQDNGAQFACQIRSLGYVNNSLVDIWSNSVTATLTVSGASVFEPGYALHQYWGGNPGRAAIENFSAGAPTWTMSSPAFEVDINGTEIADNFCDQLVGFYVPSVTGNYVFFCNSDDDSDLFLSTDSTMGNARLIAQETANAGVLNWGISGGIASQVRSDTFVDPATGTTPYASGISLTGGQKYAMKMVHHQGGGGTVSAVTAKLVSDPDPVAKSLSTIRGSVLGTYVPPCTFVTVTTQPQSVTLNNYSGVTFTAGAATDSTLPVGPETDWRNYFNNFLIFQWYENGAPIAGANSSTYSIPTILPSDNHDQLYCTIRALGYADGLGNVLWATSHVATVTVITNVPQFLYASIYTNANYVPFGGNATSYITLSFSAPMDPTALSQMGTYTLPAGLTLLSVMVNSNDFRSVALAVSGPVTFPINISVSALLAGMGGGLPVGNTSVALNTVPLTDTDIGSPSLDPAVPGMMYVQGPQAYTIACEGSDIWGIADGFNFAYEMKTNDFDVVVRQKDNKHTSNWAKGGLMVRETLDAGSRNWNIINDPVSSDGIAAPDGSGLGANAVECNTRNTPNAASGGWDFNPRPVPAYPNAWVRLKRTGNLLSAYYSSNGTSWTLQATNDPTLVGSMTALPAAVFVGLCTTAHNNDIFGADPLLYLNTVDYDNYNSSYVPAILLAAPQVVGNNITISWTPSVGHLQASPALSGSGVNWQTVGSGGSVTLPISASGMFFRVVNP